MRIALSLVTAAVSMLVVSAGCAERHIEIPSDAEMVTEGNGRLSYTAPRDGMIYVYDRPSERMIYSGEIDRGESVVIDPEEDRVMVGGKTAFEKGLRRGNEHRVFFDPGTTTERRVVVEEEREEVRIKRKD